MERSAFIKFKTSREFLDFLVSHRSIYPNLGKISCSLLVIPIHSADCERGFSTLGRIRTKLRSWLNNTSLNSLLMISMEGPDVKYLDVQLYIGEVSGNAGFLELKHNFLIKILKLKS